MTQRGSGQAARYRWPGAAVAQQGANRLGGAS